MRFHWLGEWGMVYLEWPQRQVGFVLLALYTLLFFVLLMRMVREYYTRRQEFAGQWSSRALWLVAWVVFGVLRIVFFNLSLGRYFFAYILTAVLINILYFVFSIIAAIRARKGRFYYFWFFGKLAYHYAFRVTATPVADEEVVNTPPRGM